jgi:hypothetical protein
VTWTEHSPGSPFTTTGLEHVIEDIVATADRFVVSFAQDVPGRAIPMWFVSDDGISGTRDRVLSESHQIAPYGDAVLGAGDWGEMFVRDAP